MDRVQCPKCGSSDVMYSNKKGLHVCVDCSNEFQAEIKIKERRIFLSYGHDEFSDLAFRLKKDLESMGHLVWIDMEGIKGGRDWEASIEEGLRRTSEVPGEGRYIILMTPYSVRRPDGYCLNEVAMAINLRLVILPLMVAWCEPPLSICRIQWLDMQDCVPVERKEERYKAKLALLAEALNQESVDYKGTQSRLLRLLEPLPFDADISRHLSRFTGRAWMLGRIDAWLEDANASRIFWMVAPPGFGKTAIASWLCYNRREVAAFHLCSYGHVQKSDARKCVLSIAYQLSTQLSEYRDRLGEMGLENII